MGTQQLKTSVPLPWGSSKSLFVCSILFFADLVGKAALPCAGVFAVPVYRLLSEKETVEQVVPHLQIPFCKGELNKGVSWGELRIWLHSGVGNPEESLTNCIPMPVVSREHEGLCMAAACLPARCKSCCITPTAGTQLMSTRPAAAPDELRRPKAAKKCSKWSQSKVLSTKEKQTKKATTGNCLFLFIFGLSNPAEPVTVRFTGSGTRPY